MKKLTIVLLSIVLIAPECVQATKRTRDSFENQDQIDAPRARDRRPSPRKKSRFEALKDTVLENKEIALVAAGLVIGVAAEYFCPGSTQSLGSYSSSLFTPSATTSTAIVSTHHTSQLTEYVARAATPLTTAGVGLFLGAVAKFVSPIRSTPSPISHPLPTDVEAFLEEQFSLPHSHETSPSTQEALSTPPSTSLISHSNRNSADGSDYGTTSSGIGDEQTSGFALGITSAFSPGTFQIVQSQEENNTRQERARPSSVPTQFNFIIPQDLDLGAPITVYDANNPSSKFVMTYPFALNPVTQLAYDHNRRAYIPIKASSSSEEEEEEQIQTNFEIIQPKSLNLGAEITIYDVTNRENPFVSTYPFALKPDMPLVFDRWRKAYIPITFPKMPPQGQEGSASSSVETSLSNPGGTGRENN